MDKINQSQIVIYKAPNGETKIDVRFDGDTVWLTMDQMSLLFGKSKSTINEHILNIYEEDELKKDLTIRKIGNSDFIEKPTNYYNLEVIIAVGYRVKSNQGTYFRQWATEHLKEYIIKGFAMDDVRLKQGGYKSRFFEELLERIRDIRSSERMLYQKVTDIYATSVDYRSDANETEIFFKTVQNKMHFAVSGKTAAKIIMERADSKKPLMGLTNFSGLHPIHRDIYIAKNYLNENELEKLNRIVDAYLSFAEIQAKDEHAMTMKDWIVKLDEYLTLLGKGVLKDAGNVKAIDAQTKADYEYQNYKKKQDKNYISDFDREIMKYLKEK